MRRLLPASAALTLVALVVSVPLAYRSVTSTTYRNFRVVESGRLYRSGQMSEAGLARTLREYGIRTVVSLRDARDDGKVAPDRAEAEYCAAHGVEHIVLTPANWCAADGKPAPVEPNLRRFLAVMDDPAKSPVLVHCFAGIHRTGGYVSLYRIEYGRWTAEEAIREMKGMGTVRTTFDEEIPDYLRAYVRRQDRAPPAAPEKK